jgi:hypothetical protein
MTFYNGWLYIVDGTSLWKVDPTTGTYTLIGTPGAWGGAEGITAHDDALFIVDDAVVWKLNPTTGTHSAFNTANWSGTNAMVTLY